MKRPIVKDLTAWERQILEHKRAVFERLIAAFPELEVTKRTDVAIWRAKLSGDKTGSS